MKQTYEYATADIGRSNPGAIRQRAAPQWLFALLAGIIVALVLTLVGGGILFLLLRNTGNGFSALLAFLTHTPFVLLVPVIGFVAAFLIALMLVRPLALRRYQRQAHFSQARYYQQYIPLTTIVHIHKSSNTSTGETTTVQEEQISIVDIVQQDEHQIILGVPGSGKTLALRVYQYLASQQSSRRILNSNSIVIYLPLKDYNLFLKNHPRLAPEDLNDHTSLIALQAGLLEYLYDSELPGMRYLRPHLQFLAQRGRLILLCDGLNEVDSSYQRLVSDELLRWIRTTHNRLVITCREIDYRELHDVVQMVNEGEITRAVIHPLQQEQVHGFIEQYVERQDKHWQHTAGQIVQVIDHSRLRYHCSNPMMLFMLLSVIDKIGVEHGKQIDTRGLLLHEYVRQELLHMPQQARGYRELQSEQEIVRFLSEVAVALCWASDRNTIQLPIATSVSDNALSHVNYDELADELRIWLDEHPPQGPFVAEQDAAPFYRRRQDLPQMLQQAMSAGLIELSTTGVLSFRHELLAEYFVAEYFFAEATKQADSSVTMREELLQDIGRWSEPVAIWAGLLDNPIELAEQFASVRKPEHTLSMLALALVCVGVMWTPPQAEIQRTVVLPEPLEASLAIIVRDRAAREGLARTFTRCAEEGAQEVYCSLLPLIMVEGVEELLILLDQNVVPAMLFTHLLDTVDAIAYEAQVKRLTRVLGRFGGAIVERAVQLSLPLPERGMRLRAAAINTLGGTHDARAVEPLIERLSDSDTFIVDRATNALMRLGPELSLARVLQALEGRATGPFALSTHTVHRAALSILARFLHEQDVRKQLTLAQYTRIIEAIVPVLTSNYQSESDVQQQARQVLVQQARDTRGANAHDNRWEKVIDALIRYLPSQNTVAVRNVILVLQEIGPVATSALLKQLGSSSEVVRARIIEVLCDVRDLNALPSLLRLLNDPSKSVQQQAAGALYEYAPESIPGLIDLVLSNPDELIADSAAQLLERIGEQAVVPIINALFQIVPGRTRLLVGVLERIHDPQCIPAFIALLQAPHVDPLLTVAVVRALSQFPEKRVVPSLLTLLAEKNLQISEEAVDTLSLLGPLALDDLLAVLGGPMDAVAAQMKPRARRAILGMNPFPGTHLIDLLADSSDEQTEQILLVLRTQGSDAARTMTRYLLHSNAHVRDYMYNVLSEMPGPVVVPALLDGLEKPAMREVANSLLLKFPDAAVSPLIDLLAEPERGNAAVAILPRFGTSVLVPLVSQLDNQQDAPRERARRVLVALVRQSEDQQQVLREVIALFTLPLPSQARETLLEALTDELADVDMPALLTGLEDAYLIKDVSDAFLRLARNDVRRSVVISKLIEALHTEERRRGAESALVAIGASAVAPVSELITVHDQNVARAAKNVLRDIGVPALPFIWNAHADRSNPVRRAAALEVFHSMRTEVIKDEMVALLLSDSPDDIAMALALLMERIRDEAVQHYADRTVVPELIEYIQSNDVEKTNLRIIALLLLLDEHTIFDHILQALDDYPQYRRQLLYMLLLLGPETHDAVLAVFEDHTTTPALRAALASVLGMTSVPDAIPHFAQNISAYGVSPSRNELLMPDELAVALHSLGGLLVGGYWNADKLQELRNASREGSGAHELFSVLLGIRYSPQIARLQGELQKARDDHKRETLAFTTRILADQKIIDALKEELEEMRREHGNRGNELDQTRQDKALLRSDLEKVTRERNALRSRVDQITKERNTLRTELQQALKEKGAAN